MRKPDNGQNRTWCECRCDCGKIVLFRRSYLRQGYETTSCGCQKGRGGPSRRLSFVDACRNSLISKHRARASKRKVECTLTNIEFEILFKSACHYCGAEPSNSEVGRGIHFGSFRYSGIDRIDSSKGYVPGNVVSCCKNCNLAKNDMSVDDFLRWATRLANKQGLLAA